MPAAEQVHLLRCWRKLCRKQISQALICQNMIKKADNKNIKNAQFIVGDCENLPFSNESFDIVIYAISIHHYPNPESFVKNVFRISTPGGKLIIRDPSASDLKLFFIAHSDITDILINLSLTVL